jgi:vancomycin permeability regulator SanA
MKRVVFFLIVIVLLAVAGVVVDGMRDDVHVSDVGVVLGSKVMPDGTPSERLRARLDKAADLYGQGMFKHVIVSGGTGAEGFSEAKVMADYLVGRRSIPQDAVILDEHGDNTDATGRNSAAIMKAHGFKSAVVVTQFFHVTRSRYALQRAGIARVYAAHATYFEVRDVYSLAREMFALPAYWFEFR